MNRLPVRSRQAQPSQRWLTVEGPAPTEARDASSLFGPHIRYRALQPADSIRERQVARIPLFFGSQYLSRTALIRSCMLRSSPITSV